MVSTATALKGRSLGERLILARERRDLTQQMLAHRMGIDQGWLSHMENNRREPAVDTLRRLCKSLDVSADYLLGLSHETRALERD
jgi:transcriptional regulator with XRE-family HTH domain